MTLSEIDAILKDERFNEKEYYESKQKEVPTFESSVKGFMEKEEK